MEKQDRGVFLAGLCSCNFSSKRCGVVWVPLVGFDIVFWLKGENDKPSITLGFCLNAGP